MVKIKVNFMPLIQRHLNETIEVMEITRRHISVFKILLGKDYHKEYRDIERSFFKLCKKLKKDMSKYIEDEN